MVVGEARCQSREFLRNTGYKKVDGISAARQHLDDVAGMHLQRPVGLKDADARAACRHEAGGAPRSVLRSSELLVKVPAASLVRAVTQHIGALFTNGDETRRDAQLTVGQEV